MRPILACLLLAATLSPVRAGPDAATAIRQLDSVAAENYGRCLQEARYAIELRAQWMAVGQAPPEDGAGRVKDCVNRARYAIERAMPGVRDATVVYPRAGALLAQWHEAWVRGLDRLNSDAANPGAINTPDGLRAMSAILTDAQGQLRY